MNWIPVVTIAIAGLVVSLPLCVILELQARMIVFLVRSVLRPSWRERPWSPWKIMDCHSGGFDAIFLNKPPQLTRCQSLIVRTMGVIVAYAAAWQLYFHLPR
jgi:hypothetical protein